MNRRIEVPDSCSFEDWQAFEQNTYVGYPEIVPLDSKRALVSTRMRRCFMLNLEKRTIRAEPEILPSWIKVDDLDIGHSLQSLSISGGVHPVCAVATKVGWAGVWQLDTIESISIETENGGPVYSVAVNPSGDRIALGIGRYVLDSRSKPEASVELWRLADSPVFVATKSLPGGVVDRMIWDTDGETILAATGDLSQTRGHLALLDGHSLGILEIAEIESCGCQALYLNSASDRAILCMRNRFEIRRTNELRKIAKSLDFCERLHGAAFSNGAKEVLLTNGFRIDLQSGEHRQLPELPNCTGVALLPDGTGLGISSEGIVRVWRD